MELSAYTEGLLILMGINLIAAVSYNLINGFTGQFSLGHAGFMAVGGFAAAILTRDHHWALVPSFLAGGLLAAFVGLLVGWPTLRLRGDYLAIATLGVGEIIRVLITNLKITGGAQGLSGIPSLDKLTGVNALKERMGGTVPGWVEFLPLLYLLGFVVVTTVIIWNLIHSAKGRAIISVREDEIAADAMGVNTTYYKVMAFVLGSFFAGLAGAWQVHNTGVAAAEDFNIFRTIEVLIFIVFGGLGSTSGSIVAAIFLTWLAEKLKVWTGLSVVTGLFDSIAGAWEMVRVSTYQFIGVLNMDNSAAVEEFGLPIRAYQFVLGPLWKALFSMLLILVMLVRPKGLFGTWEIPYWFMKHRIRLIPHHAGTLNLEESALHGAMDAPITTSLDPVDEESSDSGRRHETGDHR